MAAKLIYQAVQRATDSRFLGARNRIQIAQRNLSRLLRGRNDVSFHRYMDKTRCARLLIRDDKYSPFVVLPP